MMHIVYPTGPTGKEPVLSRARRGGLEWIFPFEIFEKEL